MGEQEPGPVAATVERNGPHGLEMADRPLFIERLRVAGGGGGGGPPQPVALPAILRRGYKSLTVP